MKKLLQKIYAQLLRIFFSFKSNKKVFKKSNEVDFYMTSQPFLIGIENKSDEWQEYELFGASSNYLKTNNGILELDNGVVIKNLISNSNYTDLLLESIINEIRVGVTCFMSNDLPKYLENPSDGKNPKVNVFYWKNALVVLNMRNPNGNELELNLRLAYDPYQQQRSIIKIERKYVVDAFTSIKGRIAPNSKLQVYIYPEKNEKNNI